MIFLSRPLLALALALPLTAAQAAEVKVLTAGAMKQVVLALQPEFEKRGHKLIVDNGTTGELLKRIEGDEAFDLVVLPPDALDRLAGKS